MDYNSAIDRFYAAYAAHDPGAAAAIYAEDGWHEEMAMAKRRDGRTAIAEGLAGFFRMLPDVVWHEEQRIASGHAVAVNYTMTGTFSPRPREGEPAPTPRPVAIKGLHLFEFSGDSLIGTRDYWNLDQFKQQIA